MVQNVLLIVVDSLRADRVFANNDITPELDRISTDSEQFTSCFACADKTTASVTTIQTGLYPTRHGILHHGKDVTERELEYVSSTRSIQERLQDTHTTIGCDILGSWHKSGFDQYYPQPSKSKRMGKHTVEAFPEPIEETIKRLYHRFSADDTSSQEGEDIKKLGESRPDDQQAKGLTDRLLSATDAADSPWFGFLHYWDTHLAYTADEQHLQALSGRTYEDGGVTISELKDRYPQHPELADAKLRYSDVETIGDLKRAYDAAARTVDEQIGRIYRTLAERNELDDTALIITADHGESLTENNIFFSHRELYDQTMHVPLLINAPGFSGTDDRFVQHIDLLPTILELLDKPYDASEVDGVSLVPSPDGERVLDRDAVYCEQTHDARQQAIRTREFKYIRNLDQSRSGGAASVSRPAEQLFDLTTDPGETTNLATERPDRCAELRTRLDEWLDSVPRPEKSQPTVRHPSEDEELMETLDALGYKFD